MQLFDAFSDYISNSDADATTLNTAVTVAATTAENANETANGFSSVLALFSATGDTTSAGSDELVSRFQSDLMSALGMGDLADGALESLTSEESIAKMQSVFLSMLKTDLLTTSTSDTDTSSTSTEGATGNTDVLIGAATESSGLDDFITTAFGEGGVDWNDGFDTVNLLHHIPLVSDFYQNVTSTDISAVSDLAGSFLYGGPMGLAYSVVNLGVKSMTGESITNNLWSAGYDLLFSQEITGTDESLAESAVGEQGKVAAQSAYQFARRKFDAE